jgi:hypothetical protein
MNNLSDAITIPNIIADPKILAISFADTIIIPKNTGSPTIVSIKAAATQRIKALTKSLIKVKIVFISKFLLVEIKVRTKLFFLSYKIPYFPQFLTLKYST